MRHGIDSRVERYCMILRLKKMTENGNDTSLVGRSAPSSSSSSSSSSSFPQTSQNESADEANEKPESPARNVRHTTTPLNHFEKYLQIKSTKTSQNSNETSIQDETTSFSTDDGRKLEGGDANHSQYNHFTAPLFKNNTSDIGTRQDATNNIPPRSYSSSHQLFTNAERSQTLDRFAKVFMERMGEAMSCGKLSQAWGETRWWRGEESSKIINSVNNYSLERDMVKPHITPIVWGSSCVILTLFSMRFGRWYQQQLVRSLWGKNGVATETNTASSSAKMRQGKRHPSQLEDVRLNGNHSRPHNFHNSSGSSSSSSGSGIDMTVPVDISLSLLFGISTSIFLTDKHRLLHDFAHAPLLAGKSVLAEELCIPFQEEMMDNTRNTLWQEDENLGDFDSLRAIRDFVIHCHMRDKRRDSSAKTNVQ